MIIPKGFDRSKALYVAFDTISHESDAHIAAAKAASVTSSAVITCTDHVFTVGQTVMRANTGTGWTEIPALTPLFVVAAVAGTSISVSLTEGGTAISTTGTGGSFYAVDLFYSEPLTNESATPEFAYIKRRGMAGLSGNTAQQLKSTTSEWSWECDEALRPLDLFDGAEVGQSLGYNKIYTRDPADAATVCRKVSERFYGSITTSKAASEGGGEFSKPVLKLTALKPDGSQVTFSRNVTVAV